MDPPWNESGGGHIKRGADRHYELMKTDDIIRVIRESGVFTPDPQGCHLYLWVTNSFLKDGLKVMEALGFRYITNLVWAKDHFGLGQYFRQQTELCLFGDLKNQDVMWTLKGKDTSNLIKEDKREHSQKPEAFYRLVEENSPTPRLEMFARQKREKWDAWGDGVDGGLTGGTHGLDAF